MFRKIIFISAVFMIIFLGVAAVSAQDNVTDVVASADDGTATDPHSFTGLQEKVNTADAKSEIHLEGKYRYDKNTDSKLKSGVVIDRDLTIIGEKDCTIDGAGLARCLKVKDGCRLSIQNVKFKNGYTTTGGGAIKLGANCRLTVKSCQFTGNVADNSNGGAIDAKESCTIKIYSSSFKHNKATRTSKLSWEADKRGMGGAIKTSPGTDLKIYDSKFTSNEAYLSTILSISKTGSTKKTSTIYVNNCQFTKNRSQHNGVIYSDEYGKATIKNSRFTKNTSPKGAGTVVIESSTALIKNCVFYKNKGCNGAAINVKVFSKKDSCNVKIIGCRFTKNSAAMYGGAICSVGGKLTVKDSVFSSNTARIFGGAIYTRLGSLYVSSSKFLKNKANYAGAICMACQKGSVKHSLLFKNKAYYLYSAVYKVNKNKIIKSQLKSNKCLKYSKIYFYRSGKYIMVKVNNNTDGTVKKRVRLIFTGHNKVKTKWYKTSDKKYKKIRIPKSVKGTYKVTMKVKKARYFKKTLTVTVK